MRRQNNRLSLANQIARMTVGLHISIVNVRHRVTIIRVAEENSCFDLRCKGPGKLRCALIDDLGALAESIGKSCACIQQEREENEPISTKHDLCAGTLRRRGVDQAGECSSAGRAASGQITRDIGWVIDALERNDIGTETAVKGGFEGWADQCTDVAVLGCAARKDHCYISAGAVEQLVASCG